MGEYRRTLHKIISILILLFGAGVLWGQEEIKVPARLILSASGAYKGFNSIVTVTVQGIKIESEKNIFRSFNDFDTPMNNVLFVGIQELRKIELRENQVSIYTCNHFYQEYQNYFLDIEYGFLPPQKDEAIVFDIDENAAFDTQIFKCLINPVELTVHQPFKKAAAH